jgi:hypothetical protein
MGCCPMAPKAVAGHHGGHLHAVEISCCATLGVSDAPVWQLQGVPHSKGEEQEDEAAEGISFHVYKYKVTLHKDDKERRHLGKFHCLHYWPALGRGQYHSTSYMLAARCRRERRRITRGSIGSHCDYGERMLLSFNKEIQSGYYQNTSVSIQGALLEWVDAAGVTRTCYFGHWLDDSEQDAAATMHNMRCELCINGCAIQHVNELMVGGTVWKGTDGAVTLYRYGKSSYSQGKLSAKLHIMIDAQVKAPGHGKWCSVERQGPYALLPAVQVLHPDARDGKRWKADTLSQVD